MKTNLPHFEYELDFTEKGYKYIAGIDEVGRGPWAGPVVAGAVILPQGEYQNIDGINDSKKLSSKRRTELDIIIREIASDFAIGEASPGEIDEIGIQAATFLAFERAIAGLKKADFLLIDALNWKDCRLPYLPIVKGDSISLSIAAASIIAKVYRDDLMTRSHGDFPQYGFDKHKGYGTKLHMEMLEKYGICDLHRKSFKPVKILYQNASSDR